MDLHTKWTFRILVLSLLPLVTFGWHSSISSCAVKDSLTKFSGKLSFFPSMYASNETANSSQKQKIDSNKFRSNRERGEMAVAGNLDEIDRTEAVRRLSQLTLVWNEAPATEDAKRVLYDPGGVALRGFAAHCIRVFIIFLKNGVKNTIAEDSPFILFLQGSDNLRTSDSQGLPKTQKRNENYETNVERHDEQPNLTLQPNEDINSGVVQASLQRYDSGSARIGEVDTHTSPAPLELTQIGPLQLLIQICARSIQSIFGSSPAFLGDAVTHNEITRVDPATWPSYNIKRHERVYRKLQRQTEDQERASRVQQQ